MIDKNKQVTTTVTINLEDFEWMKKKGYKATNLLRHKMKEMQREDLQKASQNFARALRFIEKKGLFQEFRVFEK